MENFRKTIMLRAYEILRSSELTWSESLKKSWSIYKGQKNTARREKLLILIYVNNSTYGFNPNKSEKKQRASRLLAVTRQRYGTTPVVKNVYLNTTAESISGNGRFSLD